VKASPPSDPRLRAFAEALAEAIAQQVVAELRAERQQAAATQARAGTEPASDSTP